MSLTSRPATVVVVLALAALLVACPLDDGAGPGPGGDGGQYPNYPHTQLDAQTRAGYETMVRQLLGDFTAPGQLSQFWANAWPVIAPGSTYRDPVAVSRYEGGAAASACGPLSVENAWYCHGDNSIYFDDNLFRYLYSHLGEGSPALILAHEWGHHIQSLLGLPQIDVQAELQADCFAGMFFGHGHAIGNIDERALVAVGVTTIIIGDRDYRASEWFQPNVHGPASWRAKAFLDGTHGDYAYCHDYGSWSERGTEPLGAYRWLPAPGIEIQRDPNGWLIGTLRGSSAYLAPLGNVGNVSAANQLPTTFANWFGDGASPVGSVIDIPVSGQRGGIMDGTVAVQAYEQVDRSGARQHGALFVHVSSTGEAAGVAIIRAGAAPSPDPLDLAWDPIYTYMYVVAFSLCPPDGSGALCLVLGGE